MRNTILAWVFGINLFVFLTGVGVQSYMHNLHNKEWGPMEWFVFAWGTLFFPPTWILIYLAYAFSVKKKEITKQREEERKELDTLRNKKHIFEGGIYQKETELNERERIIEAKKQKLQDTQEKTYEELEKRRKETEEQLAKEKSKVERYKKEKEEELKKIAEEKAIGFPFLANAYADFFELEEMKMAETLANKKHPARSSAEEVRILAQKKRALQVEAKLLKYQLNYYESLFPWLTEFKNEEIAEELIRIENTKTQDPERDGALSWLSEGEYKSLPSREKFQLALERYWKRHKTKFEIGRDYERYIGWTYEKDGYEVYYQGIIKGFDDLGRDLIVTKGREVIVVQCKYWARDKTIHEKHVFQLYGTMTSHQIENPNLKVSGRFVTSTGLSDRAKKFSDHLGIKISENTRLEEYPCIKCNIAGRDGEKIYHLPFDQQYDTTKIEPSKGEFYCRSVAEAEDKGFRRAMRYRGISKASTT